MHTPKPLEVSLEGRNHGRVLEEKRRYASDDQSVRCQRRRLRLAIPLSRREYVGVGVGSNATVAERLWHR